MKKLAKRVMVAVLSITTLTSAISFSAFAVENNSSLNKNTLGYGTGDISLDEYGPLPRMLKSSPYYSDEYSLLDIPESVDLSESSYFPPIANQGLTNSCVGWAQAYYQFSYEVNKMLDREATVENSFSPKWVYNLSNAGYDGGTSWTKAYGVMASQGNVSMADLPVDDDFRDWSPSEELWTKSLDYRITSYNHIYFQEFGTPVTSPKDPNLDEIKSALADGKVITFSTYVNCWNLGKEKIEPHPEAPENDNYLDEYIVTEDYGTRGGHRMCIVGYNDNIWCDINDNDSVESEEMGAFKVANSWGEYAQYHNDGYIWVSYDALNRESAVCGVESAYNREPIFRNIATIDVAPVDSDCDINLVYTLNTDSRNQVNVIVSAISKNGEVSSGYVSPYRDNSNCFSRENTYSFDGTTSVNDGTMVFSLDNIIPNLTSDNFDDYSWNIEIKDTISDDSILTVCDLKIVDRNTYTMKYPIEALPETLNSSNTYYTFI